MLIKVGRIISIWKSKHIGDKNFLLILSVAVGITVGFAALLLKFSVSQVRRLVVFLVEKYSFNYFYIIFPAIGIFLTIIFVNYIIKKKLGHGIPMVLRSISKNNGIIPFYNIFSRIIASSLTVGFGGSVGLEGPIVASGAAIGSNIGRFFHLSYRHIILLIGCASTAAVAAIFKAPITAVVFALEVIMLDLTTTSLLPLLLSSISAALVSFIFSGQNYIYYVEKLSPFEIKNVIFYILLGLLTGIFSVLFSKIYLKTNLIFEKVKSKWIKYFIGIIALGGIIFVFPSLYGEGYEGVNQAIQGKFDFVFENTFYKNLYGLWFVIIVLISVLLFKIIAVCSTFVSGGVGGLFAPSLFSGAVSGLLFSLIFKQFGINLPVSNFVLAGMAGVMSGVMHAPLTAIFLIAEITGGYSLFVPLMIVSAISFFTARIWMKNSIETLILAQNGELLTHNADANMLAMLDIESLIETNFLTIDYDAKLKDLISIIVDSSRNIYVVIDKENNLKGIIWLENIKQVIFNPELYDNTLVKDLMYYPEPIIERNMNVTQVAKMFEETSHYNIPVVNNEKYVGFISRAKLFSQYRTLLKKFSDD
ncbi:MAG: chloride channel protein [Bacteroidales bacterium]|nr:chloride channel protein [Bacteroidales bacterium]